MARSPNFFLVGAARSGTTSMWEYLKQHPDIYLPARKELHFFSYKHLATHAEGPGDKVHIKTLCSNMDDYIANYADVGNKRIVGEVSPSYLYYHEAGQRILDTLGVVKIVTILRNPIEKAFSQYSHLRRENRETLMFPEALKSEAKRRRAGWSDLWRYAESSLYTDKLEHYISLFGADNVKVLLFDDLVNDPNGLLRTIFSFLDVDSNVGVNSGMVYNRSGRSRSKFISNFLHHPNIFKTYAKKIISESVRIKIRMKMLDLNTAEKYEIDQESKRRLKQYFQNDVARLESLLGRKLPWLRT